MDWWAGAEGNLVMEGVVCEKGTGVMQPAAKKRTGSGQCEAPSLQWLHLSQFNAGRVSAGGVGCFNKDAHLGDPSNASVALLRLASNHSHER